MCFLAISVRKKNILFICQSDRDIYSGETSDCQGLAAAFSSAMYFLYQTKYSNMLRKFLHSRKIINKSVCLGFILGTHSTSKKSK